MGCSGAGFSRLGKMFEEIIRVSEIISLVLCGFEAESGEHSCCFKWERILDAYLIFIDDIH